MPEYLSRNIEALKKRFPLAAMAASQAAGAVDLFAAKTGAVTGRIGGILLSSAYDPVREGAMFAGAHDIGPGGHVALYGLGLGYHIKPLLEAVGPQGRIVAAEANGSILKAALEVIGDPAVISDERITFVAATSENEFLAEWARAFEKLDPARTRVAIHTPSFQSIPQSFTRVKNAVEMIRMERRFPLIMGKKEKENFRRNLGRLAGSPGVSALAGMCEGGAVIVVGAGPSLDRDITQAACCKGRAAVFAADTALPSLLAAGITPDLLFTADPQDESMRHFIAAGRYDLPLVLTPTANADLVEKWRGPLFFGFQNPDKYPKPADGWARRMGVFSSGGSVSSFALETALAAGVSVAALAGMDFGYPWGRAYANGSAPALLGANEAALRGKVEVKDYCGRPLLTSLNMYSYIRAFENITVAPGRTVVTFSNVGARLGGIEAVAALPAGIYTRRGFIVPTPGANGFDGQIKAALEQWLDNA
ncbi:MAG: motility associated factor glycosyltransferase family protein [Nitrospinae bacterium]|nr:motility associated factor glycosyltransferase family protein [Nitrospinota bacterium]